MPKIILHLEGFAVLIAAIVGFKFYSSEWLLFIILFLAPDLTFLGYLINKKFGSTLYNLAHTYILPLALFGVGYTSRNFLHIKLSLIWLAHIGMDRTIGYGLKYPTKFKDTHLHRV